MIFRFELIRHGNTDASYDHTYCGHTDLPLNDVGIEEIKENVSLGIYNTADVYFTSGLKRADMTLGIIAGDVEYEVMEGFKDCNLRIFGGHNHEGVLENKYYNEWITDETGTYIPPDGESTAMFNERVDKAVIELFEKIASLDVESAMMVSHGGVIARVFTEYVDSSLNMYEAMPQRGDGYSMTVDYSDGKAVVKEYKKVTK